MALAMDKFRMLAAELVYWPTSIVAPLRFSKSTTTGNVGRSRIRESPSMRCSLVRTGCAWAASGSMCEVTPCATPTGSNEPLYGRTDTKSPMVYSSMVHVAGGEGGSIRHDDDGRPAPSRGSPWRPTQAHAVWCAARTAWVAAGGELSHRVRRTPRRPE